MEIFACKRFQNPPTLRQSLLCSDSLGCAQRVQRGDEGRLVQVDHYTIGSVKAVSQCGLLAIISATVPQGATVTPSCPRWSAPSSLTLWPRFFFCLQGFALLFLAYAASRSGCLEKTPQAPSGCRLDSASPGAARLIFGGDKRVTPRTTHSIPSDRRSLPLVCSLTRITPRGVVRSCSRATWTAASVQVPRQHKPEKVVTH